MSTQTDSANVLSALLHGRGLVLVGLLAAVFIFGRLSSGQALVTARGIAVFAGGVAVFLLLMFLIR